MFGSIFRSSHNNLDTVKTINAISIFPFPDSFESFVSVQFRHINIKRNYIIRISLRSGFDIRVNTFSAIDSKGAIKKVLQNRLQPLSAHRVIVDNKHPLFGFFFYLFNLLLFICSYITLRYAQYHAAHPVLDLQDHIRCGRSIRCHILK